MFNPEKFDWTAFQKTLPPIGAGQEYEVHTGRSSADTSIFNGANTYEEACKMIESYRGGASNKPTQARKNYWKVIRRGTGEVLKTWTQESL